MKTPLTELIEIIDREVCNPIWSPAFRDGLLLSKEIAQSLLPKEKEGIIDSNIDGQSRHDDASKQWAEDYFNSTYQETVNEK